jgi:mRNA interferase MazF
LWRADLGATGGHEQSGARPVLVLSLDRFNAAVTGLAVVVPLTTVERPYPAHVPVEPSVSGLRRRSFVMCEQIRAISHLRLERCVGTVSEEIMVDVEKRVKWLLGLK